jgi:hypothetical protein
MPRSPMVLHNRCRGVCGRDLKPSVRICDAPACHEAVRAEALVSIARGVNGRLLAPRFRALAQPLRQIMESHPEAA